MEVNVFTVLAAAVGMFVVGAIWFTFIFGKKWGEIHSFHKRSKKEQEAMAKAMGPWYGVQLAFTIVSALILTLLITSLPDQSPFLLAFLAWLGFALPTEAGAQIFGGAPAGYVWQKISIAGAELLIRFLVGAWIISLF